MRFLTQVMAQQLDVDLMRSPGFSIEQLMELAGLSVACAVSAIVPIGSRVLAIAGPGNNGGDALVAARHLFHFGLHPTILYPKVPNSSLFVNLQQQCSDLDIPILSETPNSIEPADYDLVLDGVFGFSFDPSNGIKDPFDKVVAALHRTDVPVACIDIPSGWDVEKGDIGKTGFQPHALISLTAPKMCAEFFTGKYHFLGGRFLPPRLAIKYGLSDLPKYHGTEQCALLQDSCLNNN